MSKIRIHHISYDAQSRRMDYHASLHVQGRSISISAGADLASADVKSSSLRRLAVQHAADLLKQPSAAGYRLEALR